MVAALLTGCATGRPASLGAPTPPLTPCEQLIPDCHAERLPDLILSVGVPAPEGSQALGPVTGSTDGVIGFDQALVRAWAEDGHVAETVQVVLGGADPEILHWQSTSFLFYGVVWGGTVQCPIGGGRPNPSPSPRPCATGAAGTIIDAFTGAFIVGG